MRKLACLVLLVAACSSGGRTRSTGSTGSTNGSTGSTNGSTNGSTGSTNGGGGSTDLGMPPYQGPDMAEPTLPPDSTVSVNGAPMDAANQFGGAADPTAAPTLVYPPDGVLMPPNLDEELEIQFTPAAGTNLFEIGFVGPNGLNLRVYTTCVTVGTGCGYLPDPAVWNTIAQAGRDDTVKLTIRATSASGSVGSSASRSISFAAEDLQGGLYYWAAAAGAINRYDFGLRGQTAEAFYTTSMSGAICNGCHALSRDGSRIAVGLNIPGPATLRVLDVATRTTLYESAGGPGSSGGSNFEALTPDGQQVLTSEAGNLVLRDAATGAAIGPTITNGNMPDFSADGTQVVFARGAANACPLGLCGANPGVDSASLFVAPVMSGSFGAPVQLVAGGGADNFYYPAFSPDGSWVAFNHSGTDSFDAADAQVLIVNSAGGTPATMSALNTTLGNSWPKFAPFVHHFQGKTIFWLTFSSRRDYGLRLINSTQSSSDNQIAQLWMVAVSPDRLNTVGDGGYPPFWLPFQDMTTGNHIAQWTETVARMGCTNDMQCMQDEFCLGGECLPKIN